MKAPHRSVWLMLAFALAASACGGSDDTEPTVPSTSAPPSTLASTTTAEPTTTAPPATDPPESTSTTQPAETTTTTTTGQPLPDPARLLADLNAAMTSAPEYLASGTGIVAEQGAILPDQALLTQVVIGGGTPNGDTWRLQSLTLDTEAFSGEFIFQRRSVDGVLYEQDPESGVWEIEAEGSPDPVEDALNGTLLLADMRAERIDGALFLIGTYPADDDIDEVRVEIDPNTGRMASIGVRGSVPRSELAGLIAEDGDDLASTLLVRIASYSFDVAPIVAAPVGVATKLVPRREASFFLAIPSAWTRLDQQDIDFIEVSDAYEGAEALFLIQVEDVSGTDISDLASYVDVVETLVLDGFFIESSLPVTTLQGAAGWLISGIDPSGLAFHRLIYMSPTSVAVNVAVVQGVDEESGEPTPLWDESPGLIDFILNSFLVFRGDGSL